MALAAVVGVVGFVSGLFGIVQFGLHNFAAPDPVGSTIRVAVGLDMAGGLSNAGGGFPDVCLFNEGGEFLRLSADSGTVDDGSIGDITIDQHGNK